MVQEHIARAVGAALGQRSMIAGLGHLPELEKFREMALSRPRSYGDDPNDALERLRTWTASMSSVLKSAPPPHGPPTATMGADMITEGGTTTDGDWKPGHGLNAMVKLLHEEMSAGTPGFSAEHLRFLRGILHVLDVPPPDNGSDHWLDTKLT